MDTISQLAFYTIGLTVFFIVAWILETIYFAITGRDKPVDGSHKVGNDYRRHK